MSFDAHANLVSATVAVAPSPADSGTSLTLTAGQGARFPATPFNCTLTNSEIVRVTGIVGDVLTIIRAQENTAASAIVVGDQIALTVTAKTITDIETQANPLQGAGSPEGSITADIGKTYWDTSAKALYVKDSGSGNTGWYRLVG